MVCASQETCTPLVLCCGLLCFRGSRFPLDPSELLTHLSLRHNFLSCGIKTMGYKQYKSYVWLSCRGFERGSYSRHGILSVCRLGVRGVFVTSVITLYWCKTQWNYCLRKHANMKITPYIFRIYCVYERATLSTFSRTLIHNYRWLTLKWPKQSNHFKELAQHAMTYTVLLNGIQAIIKCDNDIWNNKLKCFLTKLFNELTILQHLSGDL